MTPVEDWKCFQQMFQSKALALSPWEETHISNLQEILLVYQTL